MNDIVLPGVVIGIDVETKSLRPDAYIIAIGAAVFDVTTMQYIGASYVAVDPNDSIANDVFHTDPDTVDWWEGKGRDPERAPSKAAYEASWTGTTKMPDALWTITNFLNSFKKWEPVIVQRGPDFDNPILMNALSQCNVNAGLLRRVSRLDSDRTVERLMAALGLDMDENTEAHHWTRGKDTCEHHAGWDAAKEAYRGARAYHLALIGKTHGFDRMKEAHESMLTGEYIAAEFITKG